MSIIVFLIACIFVANLNEHFKTNDGKWIIRTNIAEHGEFIQCHNFLYLI